MKAFACIVPLGTGRLREGVQGVSIAWHKTARSVGFSTATFCDIDRHKHDTHTSHIFSKYIVIIIIIMKTLKSLLLLLF